MFSKFEPMIRKLWMNCLNSSQKFPILLKKLGEIRKSSSYREKFIQGSDKFVRPTKMFGFLSIRVIESQLYLDLEAATGAVP